jgi:3-hydroxyacyl-[acyl-carrier-protein] dehydratase
MPTDPRIAALIPHRDPFLWVDRIIDSRPGVIITEKDIQEDLDIFRGHYPGRPLFPGVLLCEAIFQTAALLTALMESGKPQENSSRLPVITRISGARFKRTVIPGDTIQMEVELKETISSAQFFKGTIRVHGKIALRMDFATTFVVPDKKNHTTTKKTIA